MTVFTEKSKQLLRKLIRRERIAKLVTGLAIISLLAPAAPLAHAETSPLQSKMFDLSEPATQLIRDKQLHNGTVMQSFAVDDVNQRVYVLQLMAGGQQLSSSLGRADRSQAPSGIKTATWR